MYSLFDDGYCTEIMNNMMFNAPKKITFEVVNTNPKIPEIKDVIFNNPATIVIWKDGEKTIVKCQSSDTYSKEVGLAMCILKRLYGNKNKFNDIINKWIKD